MLFEIGLVIVLLFLGFAFGYSYAYISKNKVQDFAKKVAITQSISELKSIYDNFIEVFIELKRMYSDTDDILKKNFFYLIQNELKPLVIKLLKISSAVKKQILSHPDLFNNENLIAIITDFEKKLKILLEQMKDIPKDPKTLEESIFIAKEDFENFRKELLKIPIFVYLVKEANIFKDLKELIEIQSKLEYLLKNEKFLKIKREISIKNEEYRKIFDIMELIYSKLLYKLNSIKNKLEKINSKLRVF